MPKRPHERIFTKLGTNVPLVTNFVTIYSRDKILQEVKVPNFPIGDVTVITVLRYRDCDIRVKLHKSRQITAFGKMKLFTLIAERREPRSRASGSARVRQVHGFDSVRVHVVIPVLHARGVIHELEIM